MEDKNTFDVTGYLAQVSYDLRVPMGTIMKSSELILRENISKKVRACVDDIRNASAELMAMTEDVGDLVRINNGHFEEVSKEYRGEELILELRRMLDTRSGLCGIPCEFETDGDLPYRIMGDERRVFQMICKMALNAFDVTKEGRVKVSLHTIPDKGGRFFIKAVVEDEGPGVLSDSVIRVMGGRCAADSPTDMTGAVTTRLFLAKTLATQMGGRLMSKSTPGKGSVFTLLVAQHSVGILTVGQHDKLTEDSGDSRTAFTVRDARVLAAGSDREKLYSIYGKLAAYGIDADLTDRAEDMPAILNGTDYDLVIVCSGGEDAAAFTDKKAWTEAYPDRTEYFEKLKTVTVAEPEATETGAAADRMTGAAAAENRKAETGAAGGRSGDGIEALLRANISQDRIEERQSRTHSSYKGGGLQALEDMGLNTRLALQNFAGDEKEYRNVLLTLCRSSDTKGRMLNYYLEQHDYKNYIVAMHGILGVAKVIGAEWLMEKSRELEKAAKMGLKDKIEAETPDLAESFDRLLSSIRDAVDSKQTTAVKGAIDKADLISIIFELKGYLEDYQIDEIEELFYTLAQFSYPDARVVEKIHEAEEHMLNYDYSEVIKSLDSILELLK